MNTEILRYDDDFSDERFPYIISGKNNKNNTLLIISSFIDDFGNEVIPYTLPHAAFMNRYYFFTGIIV